MSEVIVKPAFCAEKTECMYLQRNTEKERFKITFENAFEVAANNSQRKKRKLFSLLNANFLTDLSLK